MRPQFTQQVEVAEEFQSTEAEIVWKAVTAEASCEIFRQKRGESQGLKCYKLQLLESHQKLKMRMLAPKFMKLKHQLLGAGSPAAKAWNSNPLS